MDPHIRVLAGERRQRFMALVRECSKYEIYDLVTIIRGGASVRAKSAALRVLTCKAPLAVTQGRCYAESRRLVRKHYGV